jgi:trans-aconitate methyltransferase
LWDRDFSRGHWNQLTQIGGDSFYPTLLRYLRGGALLDLGCATGTTGRGLPAGAFRRYIGVDLSLVAITLARQESPAHTFHVGDIAAFTPDEACDVILFRESLYYLPTAKVPKALAHYRQHLTPQGVIVVRIWNRHEHANLVQLLDAEDCQERIEHPNGPALTYVLR